MTTDATKVLVFVGAVPTLVSSELLTMLDENVYYDYVSTTTESGSIVVTHNGVKFNIKDEDGDIHEIISKLTDEIMDLLFEGEPFITFGQKCFEYN